MEFTPNIDTLTVPLVDIGRILKGIGWNDIITEYLRPVGGLLFLLKCNYETKLLPCFVPTFYKQMLDYAKEIFFFDMSYAIIWNNRSILIQNKSIYLKEWVEKGVIFVQDLINEDGSWMVIYTIYQ